MTHFYPETSINLIGLRKQGIKVLICHFLTGMWNLENLDIWREDCPCERTWAAWTAVGAVMLSAAKHLA